MGENSKGTPGAHRLGTDTYQLFKWGSFKSKEDGTEASIYYCNSWEKKSLPPADVYVAVFPIQDFSSDVLCYQFHVTDSVWHDFKLQIQRELGDGLCNIMQMPPSNFPCNQSFCIVTNGRLFTSPSLTESVILKEVKKALTTCIEKAQRLYGAQSIGLVFCYRVRLSSRRGDWQHDLILQAAGQAVTDLKSRPSLRILFIIDTLDKMDYVISSFRTHGWQSNPYTEVYNMTNGPTVQVINDDILQTTADALLISRSSNFEDDRGLLYSLCWNHGGKKFRKQLSSLESSSATTGSAFVLSGDGFLSQNVIVAIVPSIVTTTANNLREELETTLTNSLECAERISATSIALPVIGSRFTGLYEGVCPILIDTLVKYFQTNSSSCIKVIKFVDLSVPFTYAVKETLAGTNGIRCSTKHEDGHSESGNGTPFEILAHGPAAVEAYNKAAKDGTQSVYRTRLMLVGQERVGKTSLMKNITGQRFDESEEITDGVDLAFVQISEEGITHPWSIQDTAITDFAKHIEDQYTDRMCTLVAQQLGGKLETDDPEPAQTVEQAKAIPMSSNGEDMQEEGRDISVEGPMTDSSDLLGEVAAITNKLSEVALLGSDDQAHKPQIPETITRKLQEQLNLNQGDFTDQDEEGIPEFQIWDFAGQDVYYTIHQVFLTNRAIYVLVFDLRLDLEQPVEVQIPSTHQVESRFHELTGFGCLDLRMQSIYAYATAHHQICDSSKPQMSPPIFIVGTHKDSRDISTDPQERKRLITAKFQNISDMISGKPYEQHVVSRFYAVENSSGDQSDTELSSLREHIVSVTSQESYMGEKIPLRWLAFEKSVADAIKEGQHFMKLAQVKAMSQKHGVSSNAELFTMLHFYHDLGTMVYFGKEDATNRHLQDMVILDPQWLIDVFKRIITVLPRHKQWATFKTKWKRLKEEGILEDCLIDHMWHDLLPQKPALLALMEMFDLLCPQIMSDRQTLSCAYYVPTCLQPCHGQMRMHSELESNRNCITFYIDLQGFLPDGLFHQVLVHAARWSQQESGQVPKLYHRHGNFSLDDEHSFQLEMQTTPLVCIKVIVCRTPVICPGDVRDRDDMECVQPDPKACTSVKTFLADALNEVTLIWIHGIKYVFAVACPCNNPSDARRRSPPHLLPLEECLRRTKIRCNEKQVLVDTGVYRSWFQTDLRCKAAEQEPPRLPEDKNSICKCAPGMPSESEATYAESETTYAESETANAIVERPEQCIAEAIKSDFVASAIANTAPINKTKVYSDSYHCAERDMYKISGDLHIHVQEVDLKKDMLASLDE